MTSILPCRGVGTAAVSASGLKASPLAVLPPVNFLPYHAMSHKTLPFGTLVKITNPKNNKGVTVRVNDRGPTRADRVGDVSYAAARKPGMIPSGVIDAEMATVGTANARKP